MKVECSNCKCEENGYCNTGYEDDHPFRFDAEICPDYESDEKSSED